GLRFRLSPIAWHSCVARSLKKRQRGLPLLLPLGIGRPDSGAQAAAGVMHHLTQPAEWLQRLLPGGRRAVVGPRTHQHGVGVVVSGLSGATDGARLSGEVAVSATQDSGSVADPDDSG